MLLGVEDRMMKVEWTARIADYFEDVSFDTVPEAGHFIHFEQPGRPTGKSSLFSRALAASALSSTAPT